MSAFTGQELADHLYNRRLPEVYRNMDVSETEKQDLYRYMQAVIQGGFNDTLEQIAAMTDLVNPLTCPVEFLPYLYQSFGFPYFEDIGEYYNRRFLASVGELLRRRGTIGGIRYLVRVLTGMESDISYERINTEEEHARILNVYPRFPDITSLAEIEVTTYTIKRFLELYLPFYIRLIFFPAIETQNLEGVVYNGVSFANTLMQYLFTERERVLEIPYVRSTPFYFSGNFSLTKLAETNNRKLEKGNIYQKLEVNKGIYSPLNTRITSYDLTKLEGKKEPIGDWITFGDYKFRIPLNSKILLEVFQLNFDLFKPQNKILPISKYKTQRIIAKTDNDLKFERQNLIGTIQREKVLVADRNISYDLTGLSGMKLYSPESIKLQHNFEIENSRKIIGNSIKVQDLTFIEGKDIIREYSSIYYHNFRKDLSKLFAITNLKSYNLKLSERFRELKCGLNSCSTNFSIIEYDLKG